jgi:hypothetical protein
MNAWREGHGLVHGLVLEGRWRRWDFRRMRILAIFLSLGAALQFALCAAPPETAELNFDSRFASGEVPAGKETPVWLSRIEQQGGRFLDEPGRWQVEAKAAEGTGRLTLVIDRAKMKNNLVATILFDRNENADIAIQLADAQGQVVAVDLFGNIVDVGNEVATDTFVIPLKKYPTAERIVIRRIKGDVSVHGVVLYPVVIEGTPVKEALEELARVLGDPLSPENPLVKSIQQVAVASKVTIDPAKSVTATKTDSGTTSVPRGVYAAAAVPAAGLAFSEPAPADLVARWSFDQGNGTDASGNQLHGVMNGGVQTVDGLFGKAIRLRKNPSSARKVRWDSMTVPANPKLDLTDNLTISAWVKYSGIAPRWGSQIVFHGDNQFGRDPWVLHLRNDGRLEMRSDRSTTAGAKFVVVEDEIFLSPKGKPVLSQHVGVMSPKSLARDTWYFVAGTIGKTSARKFALRLYVNGEPAGEVQTEETVNYPTGKMWTTVGAVDDGTWQNFEGVIDEVRVYKRALAPAEIAALYQQPRR